MRWRQGHLDRARMVKVLDTRFEQGDLFLLAFALVALQQALHEGPQSLRLAQDLVLVALQAVELLLLLGVVLGLEE